MTGGALVVRPQPRARASAWVVVGLVVALGLVLASCSSLGGAIDTQEALVDAGFDSASVDFSTSDGFDEVDVSVDPGSLEGDGDSLSELAAGTVWTNFPLRFDDLRVTLTGPFDGYETFYTYDELLELFGPRPDGFDERSVGDDLTRTGLIAAIAVGVGLLLFVAVAVVAVILIVRASRRRARTLPPPWPPGSQASPWPPQPPSPSPPQSQPGPGGWGPPPPPG